MRKKLSGERTKRSSFFRLHPLFLVIGGYYAIKGELFLFLLSTLVAIEHELAHAFAAARLGYKLNKIVLLPFGAVIDGDMQGSFKDEIVIALCGPLSNLLTALFFASIWWFEPTVYAFTDTAYTSSLSIAFVNLLPAYPLDGGRILQCGLSALFAKGKAENGVAERRAKKICKGITFAFSLLLFILFLLQLFVGIYNFSLCIFALFLFFGGLGNKDKDAVYEKMDFSVKNLLKKGVVIRRVAVLKDCPVKDIFRFITRGEYLVLEVYDDREEKILELPQNEFARIFSKSGTPYTPSGDFFPLLQGERAEKWRKA